MSRRIKSVFGRARPTLQPGRLTYVWNGRKVLADMGAAATRALQRAEDDAREYWTQVVWNPDRHPYMTGTMMRAGRFEVAPSGDPERARLSGWVDLGEDYPVYVEFGTSLMEGQFPLRQTMDFIAPRIRQYLAEEMRNMGQGQ